MREEIDEQKSYQDENNAILNCKMEKQRKIELVVKKVTFAEAEKADDEYWANASAEERLQELIELRSIFFGNTGKRIKKVVSKRNRYEEED